MSDQIRFDLSQNDIPKFCYNINADNPVAPNPVLNPATLEPVTPDFLSVLFPMELIEQEISTERYIEIPEEVREIYKLWRPTPLIRAAALGKSAGYPSAHLLQVRRRFTLRQPQIQHGRAAGVLQQDRRDQSHDHRNRRRAVGIRPFDGRQVLRPAGWKSTWSGFPTTRNPTAAS